MDDHPNFRHFLRIGLFLIGVVKDSCRQSFEYKMGGASFNSTNLFTLIKGRSNKVIIVGAHLDSVKEGAGINDNASGVVSILESLRIIKKNIPTPDNSILFCFWGAEENNLKGSNHFIESNSLKTILQNLDKTNQQTKTSSLVKNPAPLGYINLDMVGSKNGFFHISNPDTKKTIKDSFGYEQLTSPRGSKKLFSLFKQYFSSRNISTAPLALEASSDHTAFAKAGIPTIFFTTGFGDLKTKTLL